VYKVLLDLQDQVDQQDLLVLKVQLDPQVHLVLKVFKVQVVVQDPQVQ
jgi:hypothetical protein